MRGFSDSRVISAVAHVNRRAMLHDVVKKPFVHCVQAEWDALEMRRRDHES
jgi:hypothetical protein